MASSTTYLSKVVVHAPTLLQSTSSQPRSVSVAKERVVGDTTTKTSPSVSPTLSKSKSTSGISDHVRYGPDAASEKRPTRILRSTLSEVLIPTVDTAPSTPQSSYSSTSTVASYSQLPASVQRKKVEFRFPSESPAHDQEVASAVTSSSGPSKSLNSSYSSSPFLDGCASSAYGASTSSSAPVISYHYSCRPAMDAQRDAATQPPRAVIQTVLEPVMSARSSSKGAPASTRQTRQSPIARQCRQQEPARSDATQSCFSQISQARGLEVDTVNLSGRVFDPAQPLVRRQIAGPLRILETAQVEALQGHRGGLNEGIWFVLSHDGELVLKLVAGSSAHPAVPTECESLARIARTHPSILSDSELAFPHQVLRLQGCSTGKPRDLIVARRAPGCRLQEVMSQKLQSGRQHELAAIFEAVGACVARFHCRYGNSQHGDLTAANIMYEESSGRVTLIDLGGMGDTQIRVKDLEHFPKSIELLTKRQDPFLASSLFSHFQLAYTRVMKEV